MALPNLPDRLPPFRPLPPSLNVIPFVYEGQWTVLEQLAHLRAYIKWLIECVKEFEKWAGEIYSDIENIHSTINQILNNIDQINNKLTEIENNIIDYDNRITELELNINEINEQITALNNSISSINVSITNLTNRLNIVENNITNITTEIDNIREQVDNINNIIGDVTDLSQLTEQVQTNTSEISTIKTKNLRQDKEIENIKKNYIKKAGDEIYGDLVFDRNTGVSFKTLDDNSQYLIEGTNNLSFGEIKDNIRHIFLFMKYDPDLKLLYILANNVVGQDKIRIVLQDITELYVRNIHFNDGTTMNTVPLNTEQDITQLKTAIESILEEQEVQNARITRLESFHTDESEDNMVLNKIFTQQVTFSASDTSELSVSFSPFFTYFTISRNPTQNFVMFHGFSSNADTTGNAIQLKNISGIELKPRETTYILRKHNIALSNMTGNVGYHVNFDTRELIISEPFNLNNDEYVLTAKIHCISNSSVDLYIGIKNNSYTNNVTLLNGSSTFNVSTKFIQF